MTRSPEPFEPAHLRAFADLSGVGVLFLGPELEIVYASETALEAARAATLEELRAGWDAQARERLREALARAQSGRVTAEVELGAADEPAPMVVELAPVDRDPRRGYCAILTEARTRRARERAARRAARMSAVGAIQRGLVHDLRVPLNAMTLLLELVQKTLRKPSLEESDRSRALEHLRLVREELGRFIRHLDAFVEDTGPGEGAPQETVFPLGELLRDIHRLLRPSTINKGIEWKIALDQRSEMHIRGCREELKHALLYIAINAIEAMPRGGELGLESHRNGQRAAIVIWDSGAGIREEDLRRIWSADFTTRTRGAGTGLPAARSTIEAHGGSITVDPGTGRGARFRILLPLAQGPDVPPGSPGERS